MLGQRLTRANDFCSVDTCENFDFDLLFNILESFLKSQWDRKLFHWTNIIWENQHKLDNNLIIVSIEFHMWFWFMILFSWRISEKIIFVESFAIFFIFSFTSWLHSNFKLHVYVSNIFSSKERNFIAKFCTEFFLNTNHFFIEWSQEISDSFNIVIWWWIIKLNFDLVLRQCFVLLDQFLDLLFCQNIKNGCSLASQLQHISRTTIIRLHASEVPAAEFFLIDDAITVQVQIGHCCF